ncbi:MAG: T9SS type A sorting domain-containing protein [Ignavibacteriaceae bacterium]
MKRKLVLLIFSIIALILNLNAQQYVQQGNKLFGMPAIGTGWQGYSVSLSADGNTAIFGARIENANIGAAFVFTRLGNIWTQQAKLVGTGAVGNALQGCGVAISADGNTAVVGGANDDAGNGAAWVFTRVGNTWTQQGEKLFGTGAVGKSFQGYQVDISDDGNTIISGGYQDNAFAGAAWIFTRIGNTWTQQGNKLVGTGAVGSAQQGVSVSLSSDGNTALLGSWGDNTYAGAAWVFTRIGNTWTQQGNKLIGTGAIGNARQGYSVALSGDGNTAVIGGYGDNTNAGAAWIFTRLGNTWTQQGPKLVGSKAIGNAGQGGAVDISKDGNTVIIGGGGDNTKAGAAWVFTRIGNTWTQLGSKFYGKGAVGNAQQGVSVKLSADGNTAIIGGWYDNAQAGASWVFVRSNTYSVNLNHLNLNRFINDNQIIFDTIYFSPFSSLNKLNNVPSSNIIQSLSVSIDSLSHSKDDDLEISLIHLGVEDTIIYRAGGTGQNFINTVIFDSASTPIESGSAPFSGEYKPFSSLSKFSNMDPEGAWILKVYDRATGNTGILDSWELTINIMATPTSVEETSSGVPNNFELLQNYPNPFNPSTKIEFHITETSFTSLKIYDLLGREVSSLLNEDLTPGKYAINFDGKNLSSGIYLYKLDSGKFSQTKKMILLK